MVSLGGGDGFVLHGRWVWGGKAEILLLGGAGYPGTLCGLEVLVVSGFHHLSLAQTGNSICVFVPCCGSWEAADLALGLSSGQKNKFRPLVLGSGVVQRMSVVLCPEVVVLRNLVRWFFFFSVGEAEFQSSVLVLWDVQWG